MSLGGIRWTALKRLIIARSQVRGLPAPPSRTTDLLLADDLLGRLVTGTTTDLAVGGGLTLSRRTPSAQGRTIPAANRQLGRGSDPGLCGPTQGRPRRGDTWPARVPRSSVGRPRVPSSAISSVWGEDAHLACCHDGVQALPEQG